LFLIEHSIMQPNRPKVLAGHRRQNCLVCHFGRPFFLGGIRPGGRWLHVMKAGPCPRAGRAALLPDSARPCGTHPGPRTPILVAVHWSPASSPCRAFSIISGRASPSRYSFGIPDSPQQAPASWPQTAPVVSASSRRFTGFPETVPRRCAGRGLPRASSA